MSYLFNILRTGGPQRNETTPNFIRSNVVVLSFKERIIRKHSIAILLAEAALVPADIHSLIVELETPHRDRLSSCLVLEILGEVICIVRLPITFGGTGSLAKAVESDQGAMRLEYLLVRF